MLIKTLMSVASRGGPNGRLSVLIFHRVLPEPDALFPNEMYAQHFDEVCGWLKSWFNVLPLDKAVKQLRLGSLPARAACITFDDGYADNHDVAAPILRRHGLTATFFIATGFLDGGRMWNDKVIESIRAFDGKLLDLADDGLGSYALESAEQRRMAIDVLLSKIKYFGHTQRDEVVARLVQRVDSQLPDHLMMTAKQVVLLRKAGMQIGAHTCTHPILATLSDDFAWREICESKHYLESLLQESVTLFAYPNGKPGKDYLPEHVKQVRAAGFAAALSTAPGVASTTTDTFQLPRFTPWDNSKTRFGLRMLANMRPEPRAVT